MDITPAQALLLYPELAGLLAMREDDWRFRDIVEADWPDKRAGIVGSRNRARYTDGIWIFDRANVVGVRVLAEEYGGGTVWRRDGNLEDVIAELGEVPEPGERLAPTLVKASSLLWTP